MTTLTPDRDRTSTLKSWLLVPIALLCLPADWIGVLWFVYRLVSEQKIVHSQIYDLLIFAAHIVVAGFGIFLWGFAFILWSVLIFSKTQGRVKAIRFSATSSRPAWHLQGCMGDRASTLRELVHTCFAWIAATSGAASLVAARRRASPCYGFDSWMRGARILRD
jgi:hypothetical protein